jgi:signal transduction histidine kinase
LERINISELLHDAYTNFSILAEQNNISIKISLPSTPFIACVDADAFNKIVYNLLSNAVKYGKSSVLISLLPYSKTDNFFTILIKNDGYLIPEQLKEKIFEPFNRIRDTETKEGTGIGLALARSLAEIHNGKLCLEDPEDNMNVFSLILPVHHETEGI